MADWAQLFLESDPSDVALAEAVAHALAQEPAQVRVVDGPSVQSLAAWHDARVQTVIVRDVLFGRADARFPVLLEVRMRNRAEFTTDQMQQLAVALGMPIVTNVGGTDDGYRWSLVLATREVRNVRLGDDDAFVLTPEDDSAMKRARLIVKQAA